MNQSLWEKLQRVRLKDLLSIFLLIVAIPISLFYQKKHRDLWLFCDLPNEARDNAFWLYQYIRQNHPEQETVFALNPQSPDASKVKAVGRMAPFGGLVHWVMYLSAHNIISSHKASGPNSAVCYILERYCFIKGNKVFLQHGVIKHNISFLYYKYTHIRLFTCTAEREFRYVRDLYGYPPDHVKLLGLCRFDQLLGAVAAGNQILIMPTWRKWLCHPTRVCTGGNLRNTFVKSDYYYYWNSLINCDDLIRILEDYDLHVIFYLHREMQKFKGLFHAKSDRIQLLGIDQYDIQSLIKESRLLITDYSSVDMDFAYMDKPLFYYQFDQKEFQRHHLEQGYFDYEKDGFGKVCTETLLLVKEIKNLVKNEFNGNPIYAWRRKSFFTVKDGDNCKRTWEAIVKL